MKLNEKSVASFAVCPSPIDKEGYLSKKSERGFQRRWFVLKGNLLFYFEKKQDKEPLGVVVLEACSVQASSQVRYAFEISFDGVGTRTYVILADNDEDMQAWMKAISHSSYEYLRTIVNELQRRVNEITSSSKPPASPDMRPMHVGPAKAPPSGATAVTSGALLGPVFSQATGGPASAVPVSSPPKVKIRNGILVDVEEEEEEEAPPVPPKARDRALRGSSSPTDSEEVDSPSPSKGLSRSPHQVRTLPPHSSPMVAPVRVDPGKPLSPTSTFDRTAVLEPTRALSTSSASRYDTVVLKTQVLDRKPDSDTHRSEAGSLLGREGGTELRPRQPPGLFDMATSHPPGQQLISPTASSAKKSDKFYDVHDEFTQAMKELKSERT